MIYETVIEMTATELKENLSKCKKIRPVYKLFGDDIQQDISWVRSHSKMIVGAACEFIWDLYYKEFLEHQILSKHRFYELVRRELNLECKLIRLSSNTVKYCFMESQHHQKTTD